MDVLFKKKREDKSALEWRNFGLRTKKRTRWDVLVEQMINAVIVGGIAALSISFNQWEAPLKAFGITFLVEMRKYRKL